MKWYFAYGANLHIEGMRRRCPDALPVTSATLPGYRLEFDGVATVMKTADNSVPGALWYVSDSDLASLDRFEGYPKLYDREKLQVELPNGDKVRAWVYVMPLGKRMPPSDYYLEIIWRGYLYFGLPTKPLRDACGRAKREHAGLKVIV